MSASAIDKTLFDLGSKLAMVEYDFPDFVLNTFAKSFPGKRFDYWHIMYLADTVQHCLSTGRKLGAVLPRFHLKSTILGYATCIYQLLKGKDMMYLSYRDAMSKYHTTKIKEIVATNPELRERMIDMSPLSESMCKFHIDGVRIARVLNGGIFSFKRGTHVDGGVICDDILRDPEAPLSFTQIKKVTDHVMREIINIPVQGAPTFILGTPMHPEDMLMTLRENSGFEYVYLPVFDPTPEREVLWPEVYPREWLEEHKRIVGWRAFQTEFMLVPVSETEAFFRSDEVFALVDPELKNHSIYAQYRRPENVSYVLGGADIGKKRHPSHLAVFEITKTDKGEPFATMIHQSWMDEMTYVDQKEYLEVAMESFGMDALYVDNTRGEMEERGLDPAIRLITFGSAPVRKRCITALEQIVSKGNIRFLGDSRFISQFLSVNGSLQAPETSFGHGESFFSVALAALAIDDRLGLGGTTIVGDLGSALSKQKLSGASLTCPHCKSPAVELYKGTFRVLTVAEADGMNCLDCGKQTIFQKEVHSSASWTHI
jgi:hypothetical protein